MRRLIEKNAGSVHLLGVCGIGMAGVAFLLKARGFKVSGCDTSLNRLADWLVERDIKVGQGHDPAHISRDTDWVIRSAAVSLSCPEVLRANELGLPVFSRGEVLPVLLENHTSVAVAGTHGKTTTTTLIAQILKTCGRNPSWCIGGENETLGGVAGAGNGGHIVVEADESDGTLALYKPDIAIVTNIEFDHMEHFANVEAFEDCFRTFVGHTRKRVAFCADDPRARKLCKGLDNGLSYGLSENARLRGTELSVTDSSISVTVHYDDKELGRIELPVPGRHNALNALAVTAACLELGLSFDEIRAGLKGVSLPRRRFEKVVEQDGILVVSDYAHHPTEIAALIRTAGRIEHSRLLAVFQPHRYTRTLALGPDFPAAFDGVDRLVLVPVYAASEEKLKGGTTWDLYRHFRECEGAEKRPDAPNITNGGSGGPALPKSVVAASSLEQAWDFFRRELKRGDIFLIVGAGDIEKIAGWAKESVKTRSGNQGWSGFSEDARLLPRTACGGGQAHERPERSGRSTLALSPQTIIRFNEPLANKTTFKVGGKAEIWIEAGSQEDLGKILGWTREHAVPFHMLGAGSNVVVSDLGVRGITARLTGEEFGVIEETQRGIAVGAGVPLAGFLSWTEERGYSGYEFLEGIPGTMGGAIRMNAGAWGSEICRHVQSVRCMNINGAVSTINVSDLEYGYRRCASLDNRIALDVVLRPGSQTNPEKVRTKRAEIATSRKLWKGLRCAGSVFKNPANDFAGRLIDRAGLKGTRIGGAFVSDLHANVIVTEEGALASDVISLIETVRDAVLSQSGVKLETEVVLLE